MISIFCSRRATLTADIPDGTYTYGQLAYQIKKALEVAGASVYDVRYNYSTRIFTLTSDGSGAGNDFEIVYASSDIAATIGLTGNKTGALTYAMDSAVPAAKTTLTLTQRAERPEVFSITDREDFTLENGDMRSASYGTAEEYRFDVTHESVASAQGVYDLNRDAGAEGAVIDFYPDSTSGSYVEVKMVDREVNIREMTAEGLYRKYAFRFNLRVMPSNAGSVTLRTLIDRTPS